ncbi:MAG: hypothetical protein ACP5PT_01800 [Brevinematia bacterium]
MIVKKLEKLGSNWLEARVELHNINEETFERIVDKVKPKLFNPDVEKKTFTYDIDFMNEGFNTFQALRNELNNIERAYQEVITDEEYKLKRILASLNSMGFIIPSDLENILRRS